MFVSGEQRPAESMLQWLISIPVLVVEVNPRRQVMRTPKIIALTLPLLITAS